MAKIGSNFVEGTRGTEVTNAIQVNVSLARGDVEIDIDLGNPSSGLLGLIIHGVQVGVNALTQNDNNYNCGT